MGRSQTGKAQVPRPRTCALCGRPRGARKGSEPLSLKVHPPPPPVSCVKHGRGLGRRLEGKEGAGALLQASLGGGFKQGSGLEGGEERAYVNPVRSQIGLDLVGETGCKLSCLLGGRLAWSPRLARD